MRWKSQVQPSAKSNSIQKSSDCCSQVGFDGHLQPGAFLAYLSLVIAPSPIVQHYKCIGIVLSEFADLLQLSWCKIRHQSVSADWPQQRKRKAGKWQIKHTCLICFKWQCVIDNLFESIFTEPAGLLEYMLWARLCSNEVGIY